MPLSKGITGKTGNLFPNFKNNTVVFPFFSTVFNKLLLYFLELVPRTELTTHPSSQDIGFTQGKVGKMVGNLDNNFLLDHHPICIGHQIKHYGMGFFLCPAFVSMAKNILAHHTAFSNARSDDRTCRHKSHVIIDLQLV